MFHLVWAFLLLAYLIFGLVLELFWVDGIVAYKVMKFGTKLEQIGWKQGVQMAEPLASSEHLQLKYGQKWQTSKPPGTEIWSPSKIGNHSDVSMWFTVVSYYVNRVACKHWDLVLNSLSCFRWSEGFRWGKQYLYFSCSPICFPICWL